MDTINKISKELNTLFFYNKKAYAIQEEIEGSINFYTKYDKMDVTKLAYYMKNKKSLLAYQQNFDKLMWVCLDFDIKTHYIKQVDNYDYFKDNIYRPLLLAEVKKTIKFISERNIHYLLEYSGNRGIHIWIFFKSAIPKRIGFEIINKIQHLIESDNENNRENPIGIDLFPKVPESRNNKVGKGVKIPLAFHLKSRRYSYLIDDMFNIEPITDLGEDFLNEQLQLLSQIKKNDIHYLLQVLDINNLQQIQVYDRVNSKIIHEYSPNDIINMLSRCVYYKNIFEKDVSDWNEEERKLLVGTLIRLKYTEDDDYGMKILISIFSNSDEYDEKLTIKKLNMLRNLYPPTIQYLESIFRYKCQYCAENNIRNVIELIDDSTISHIEFDCWDYIVKWSIASEKNYLMKNDEAPLNFIFDELSTMNETKIIDTLNEILSGNYPKPHFFSFLREETRKPRQMYALSAKDRVLTTAIMKYIYDVIGDDKISDISYSYKINSIPTEKEIFIDWNQLWLEFVKNVTDYVFHESYRDYYVIRLDIKSFYDSIDITLLQQILHSQSDSKICNNNISLAINNLDEVSKKKYINACNYLVFICKNISINSKGVPQGPAFARYLAELYLSVFDIYLINTIEKDYDVVLRYVDDYYILIKERDVYERVKNSIPSELRSIYLEINEKCLYGRISDIKDVIIEKHQLEKYFVDGVSKNAPIAVIDKAVSILHNMLLDIEESCDVKNFPFFLTHLLNDEYKKRFASKIIALVTSSNIGRGSMFKHFYNKFAFEYSDLSFYKEIKGLSRLNFLCQFTNKFKLVASSAIEIINYYLEQELSEMEIKEIIRIVLITGIDVNLSKLLLHEDNVIFILDCLCRSSDACLKNICLSENNFIIIIGCINSYPDKIKSLFAFENFLSRVDRLYRNDMVVNHIYSLLFKNLINYNKSPDCLQKAFNLLAYISLYDDIDRIKKLWSDIVINEITNINAREWLKYESKIKSELPCSGNIASIILNIFSGYSFINNEKSKYYENEYAFCLLTFIFSNIEITNSILNEKDKENIINIAKKTKIEFISWLLEGASSLLDHYFTMKNLQHNNRMILSKGNLLLVRGNKEIFKDDKYRELIEEKWSIGNKGIFYLIIQNEKSFQNFRSHFKERCIIDVIKHINYISSTMFEKNKIVNIFENGSYSTDDDKIAFDYSVYDKIFIFEDKSEISIENVENIKTRIIINILEICNEINISPYNFYHEFSWKNISNDIIPQNIISKKGYNSEKSAYEYLILFSQLLTEYLTKNKDIDMYSAEILRIKTLQDIYNKKLLFKNIKDSPIERVLSIYNYGYENEYNNYLLYKKIYLFDDNNTNILIVLQTLIESIKGNLFFDFVSSLSKLIQGYIDKLVSLLNNDLNNYALVKIHFMRGRNIIEIDNKPYHFNNIGCYFLKEGKTVESIILTDENSYEIERTDLVFFNNNKLIVLPAVYSRCLEIIKNKSDVYDFAINEDEKKSRLKITNCSKYNDAIEVIKMQRQCDTIEAERLLFQFLRNSKDNQIEAVINVISNYHIINDNEIDLFIAKLKLYLDCENRYVIPLKNYNEDRNGLYEIIIKDDRVSKDFDRGEPYSNKLTNCINEFTVDEINNNKIIFISDIGLSGGQVKNVLNNYKIINGNKREKSLYHFPYNLLVKRINAANQIVFLNVLYTPVYKRNIIKLMKELFNVKEDIILFCGTELTNFEKHCFIAIHKIFRDNFLEFVKDKYDTMLNMKVGGKMKYSDYLKLCNTDSLEDDELIKTLLLGRRKSLPKFSQLVLRNNIFCFKKEEAL